MEADSFGPLSYLATFKFGSLRKLSMILAFDLIILIFKIGHWSMSSLFLKLTFTLSSKARKNESVPHRVPLMFTSGYASD